MLERKDASENRTLILKTAESLFAEHGVQTVSMHQIAKTAGVGQGTLYRKYAHKGDLCLDLIQDFSSTFMERVTDYLNAEHALPAEQRLGSLLDLWVDAIEEKAEILMTIDAHHMKDSEEARTASFFQSHLYRFMREKIAGLLTEVSKQREDWEADPLLTAHALICSMAPHGHFHMKKEKGYTTQQLKNNYRHMCRLPLH